jgi:hypothetical protein
MSIKPETLAWLRQTAKFEGGVTAQVLLHLLERADALEQQPTCANSAQVPPAPEAAPVATDEELLTKFVRASHEARDCRRAIYDLGRQHGAAQAQATEFAADAVRVHCPETCWIEIRRIADGKVIYSNYRKGELTIPVGEPPAAPPAPAGGLVERVGEAMERHHVIGDIEGSWDAQARAAIREVAAWLDERGMHGCSLWLREEMDRG